ncbi:hypothetical protein L6279_03440 [Candidatus Parcubacteria bacterium]|nr:hypothetical protein [Patescibacteria group bacterium]MCG2693134.1 hypothetical protein [Candidatus Parcubacteria bacterium]
MPNQTVIEKEKIIELPIRSRLKNENAWLKLKKLGEKISRDWKSKKTAVELIREGRR